MEAYCSFKTLANEPCGHGKKSSSEIIPLVSCTKSIDTHLSNCRKMLKHTGDEETDLCAMLNKMSTVRYKYIGNI